MRCLAAILASCLSVALLAGCGGGGGVAAGATVSAYVAAPLCAGARRALSQAGGEAGSVHVRAVCLPSDRAGGRLDLAAVGANARRATEDATTIAYLEAPEAAAAKFTHPILESADVGWTASSSGEVAMRRVLRAVSESDLSSLRDGVREALEGS
jgi:hypothetical protein